MVAFSTTPGMAAQIDRAATERSLSRSELLRKAVERYLGEVSVDGTVARESSAAYATRGPAAAPPLYGLHRVLENRTAVRETCTRHGVRRLWVFGSAVRDDFVPGSSDYDFEAEFEPGFDLGPWATHLFELADELGAILGARADVGQATPIENPHVREAVEAERVLVHESA